MSGDQTPVLPLDTSPPAEEFPLPSAVPTVDPAGLAAGAVAAFCRPGLDQATWIAELYPVLSQRAGSAYETVDPAEVPCSRVLGAASVRDGDDFTSRLVVPTDAGDYLVTLQRATTADRWAVDEISPAVSR